MSDATATVNQPEAAAHGHDEHGHDHPPHLAHHFESMEQQFDSGKLGMWLFLATEVLFFGGLFCAYVFLRSNQPEVFEYASQFLNRPLGATNTAVLILSSLTMAMAVWASQVNRQLVLKVCLILTLLGACGFMVIKYFEYSHKFHENQVWGTTFYQPPHHGDGAHGDGHGETHGDEAKAANAAHPPAAGGETLPQPGDGQAGEQDNSSGSETRSHSETVTNKENGDSSTPPENAGADSGQAGADSAESDSASDSVKQGQNQTAQQSATAAIEPPLLDAEPSVVAPAASGPDGMVYTDDRNLEYGDLEASEENVLAGESTHHLQDPRRPPNTHLFFGIYFCMTGLHGIHVLVGIGVIGWILFRAFRGEFGPEYYTPVDLTGLYWHIVDLVWIFLFPLFYLL